MYNLERKEFFDVAKKLSEGDLLPIFYHQKAVCNLFGIPITTHHNKDVRTKFLNTILNQYDSVKEKLEELCIDEKALKQMQNCTFLLEQVFDTQKKLIRFSKKNRKDPDKDPNHRASVVYNSSFLLMSYIDNYTTDALYILENYLEAKIIQLQKLCTEGLSSMEEELTDFELVAVTCEAILDLYEEVCEQFYPQTKFHKKFPLALYDFKR